DAEACPVPVKERARGIAAFFHKWQAVRGAKNRPPRPPLLFQPPQALLLEVLVADGEDLVDKEDVSPHLNGDGEAQPQQHAGGVVLGRDINEGIELRELDDVPLHGADLPRGEAEEGGAQVDVLAAGEVWVNTQPPAEERRQT